MRWSLIGLLFLATAAWGDPYGAQPSAYPTQYPSAYPTQYPSAYPAPQGRPTTPGYGYPYASPGAVSSAASASSAAVPAASAARPTPAATETPMPSLYKPYATPEGMATPEPSNAPHYHVGKSGDWGLALRGGAAMPLGGLSTDNSSGGAGGLDVIYRPADKVSVCLEAMAASMPYTTAGGGGASPMDDFGGAVKLELEVFRVEALSAWLGFGAGYEICSRTEQVPNLPEVYPVTFHGEAQTVSGLALLGVVGAGYDFDEHWSLGAEVQVLNLSLQGGTSDDQLVAVPTLGLKYMF